MSVYREVPLVPSLRGFSLSQRVSFAENPQDGTRKTRSGTVDGTRQNPTGRDVESNLCEAC